jgi:PAS domain S-box-containing protein
MDTQRKAELIQEIDTLRSELKSYQSREAEWKRAKQDRQQIDITAHKQAEEEIRRAQQRMEMLVTSSTVMLYTCNAFGDFDATFVSDNINVNTGYTKEEFLSKGFWTNHIHPEDAPKVFKGLAILFEHNYHKHEYRFMFKDGTYHWMYDELKLFRDSSGNPLEIIGNWSDITERKQAEEALGESEDKFKYAFDYSVVGRSITLPTGEVQVNKAFCEMLGYSPEELQRIKWQDITHPDDIEFTQREIDSILSDEKEAVRFTKRYLQKNGSIVWTDISTALRRDKQGKPLYFLSTIVDITERKQAEEEISKLNEELEERVHARTAQLEAANKELEAFSYTISHDLRAPLRAIDGFSRILLEEYTSGLPAEAQRYLGLVHKNTQQMEHLIEDLLAFSRLSRQPLNKQRVTPVNLVRQALVDLRAEQEGRQVKFIIGDLPACQADPILLKQIYVNLLSNALKFSRKRETACIEIGCEPCEGSKPSQSSGETIYFVKDNGVGFDMQYINKLFGVFQRLHRAEEYEGTGVGLAIVQRIVHRHGGRVWAEAEVDKGAAFYFTLGGGTQ